jgi:hypothetical protein
MRREEYTQCGVETIQVKVLCHNPHLILRQTWALN